MQKNYKIVYLSKMKNNTNIGWEKWTRVMRKSIEKEPQNDPDIEINRKWLNAKYFFREKYSHNEWKRKNSPEKRKQ